MSTPKPWEHAKSGEGSATDPLAARFVESLSYDTRLYGADIRGSIAHARMLADVKLISRDDLAAIERGLGAIKREIEAAPAGVRAVGVGGADHPARGCSGVSPAMPASIPAASHIDDSRRHTGGQFD